MIEGLLVMVVGAALSLCQPVQKIVARQRYEGDAIIGEMLRDAMPLQPEDGEFAELLDRIDRLTGD